MPTDPPTRPFCYPPYCAPILLSTKYQAALTNSPVPYSMSTSYMDDSLEVGLRNTTSWLTEFYTPLLQAEGMNLKLESSDLKGAIQYMQYCIQTTAPMPTFSYYPRKKHRYIEYSLIPGPRYYTSLVMSLLCTLEMYSSDTSTFMKGLEVFLIIFHKRGWPKSLIKKGMIWYLRKRHHTIMREHLYLYLGIWHRITGAVKQSGHPDH